MERGLPACFTYTIRMPGSLISFGACSVVGAWLPLYCCFVLLAMGELKRKLRALLPLWNGFSGKPSQGSSRRTRTLPLASCAMMCSIRHSMKLPPTIARRVAIVHFLKREAITNLTEQGCSQCLAHLEQGKEDLAYEAVSDEINAFLKEFRDSEEEFLVAPMKVIASALRVVATMADAKHVSEGKKGEHLGKSVTLLRKCFSFAFGSRVKRMSAVAIANTLFKSYFRLDTLGQCKQLIRYIEMANFASLEDFPKADKVRPPSSLERKRLESALDVRRRVPLTGDVQLLRRAAFGTERRQ